MILVTFKLFDIRFYQPHMFNIIANENVKNMLLYGLLADACEMENTYKRLLITAQKLLQSRGFYQKGGNEM